MTMSLIGEKMMQILKRFKFKTISWNLHKSRTWWSTSHKFWSRLKF